MLSPALSTASPVLTKPSSPTISSDIPDSYHSQTSPIPPSTPFSLSSTQTFPLIDISNDSSHDPASLLLPTLPPISCIQPSSPPLQTSSPNINFKLYSPLPPQKRMSPQMPKPPLPAQLPSALPKISSSPLPRPPPPVGRPSAPPHPRPPLPVASKPPVPASPVSNSNEPVLPGISILDKLIKTCPVWLQLGMKQDRAMQILSKTSPGIFLVRRDPSQKPMVLSVRFADQLGEPQFKELHIKEDKSLLYLEGSVLVFENIFKLIAFYCVSRDILPFPLKLPQAILQVATYDDMEVISSLGSEIIIEVALCKSVLKPLRVAVYNKLKDIHSRAGNLKKLKENQQVVLGTTTTDLGVTTSVPEMAVIEKIQAKLGNMHKEYSPQKKIDMLLKTCKIIYESMTVGCPGKSHGADDLLPVLMYVLARINIGALLLDVEYMMELMDPALQLGEGSYYLTTTYGALEHIKNFDKQAVTRHLSLEIQDSIHRWERRRTQNKARASRSSVQDFINVSFMEAGSNTKTLGVRPNTTAQDLCNQCAEKYEVLDPESYCLSVLVDGHYMPLAPEEFPLAIKSSMHHSEPRKEYYFVYRHGRWPEEESVDQTPPKPAPEESLI